MRPVGSGHGDMWRWSGAFKLDEWVSCFAPLLLALLELSKCVRRSFSCCCLACFTLLPSMSSTAACHIRPKACAACIIADFIDSAAGKSSLT